MPFPMSPQARDDKARSPVRLLVVLVSMDTEHK